VLLFWLGLLVTALPALVLSAWMVGLYFYLCRKYLHLIVRIFQEKPLFVVPRGLPVEGAEDVRIPTAGGRTLAVGRYDDVFAVNLWDPSSAELQGRLRDPASALAAAPCTEATLGVAAVAFSPDGATLAAGCADGTIRLWDIASGELRRAFSGHVGVVKRLAFAPDGRTLASQGEDRVLNLWHLATGQRLFSLDTHGHEPYGLAFSGDGRLLVAGARSPGDAGQSALLMWRADPAGP